jgi:hypothetical protein
LLHLPTGTYLGLDRAATRIVDLLEQEGDVESAASVLAGRFGIPQERARADVTSVLDSIRRLSAARHGRGRRPTVVGSAKELRRWWRLPARRRRLAGEAFLVVAFVEVGLRLVDLDRLAKWVGVRLASRQRPAPTRANTGTDAPAEREQLAQWAVGWVLARWTHDATCLRQALAFGWFLRGRDPLLHIGLLDSDEIVAHAWIEAEGLLYNALPVTGSFIAGPGVPPTTPHAGLFTGRGSHGC